MPTNTPRSCQSPESTSVIIATPRKSQLSQGTPSRGSTKRACNTLRPKITDNSSIEGSSKKKVQTVSRGSIVSRARVASLSVGLHQKLGGPGQFSGRDGLISFTFAVLLLKILFGGAGVFLAIGGQHREQNETSRCDLPAAFVEGSIWNVSFCSEIEEWYSCVRNVTAETIVQDYSDAAMYVITIMSTIGYGHVVATGIVPQIAMIIYAMLSIPIFFMLANFVAEWVRQEFAVIYGRIEARLERRRQSKQAKKSKSHCIAQFPDLIPFMAYMVIAAIYSTATAGVFCAFTKAAGFDSYTDSLYYFLQSAFLIGFGDVLPRSSSFQLAALAFIVFAIILVWLILLVLEEWTKHGVKQLIDRITAKKEFKEQTLEDLLAVPAPEGVLFDIDRSHGPVRQLGSFRSEMPPSIHSRPFSVGRIGIESLDDDNDDPSHLANVHL